MKTIQIITLSLRTLVLMALVSKSNKYSPNYNMVLFLGFLYCEKVLYLIFL